MSDLISRQAAIEKISETIWDTAVANDVKTTLKELPSAQPEPVKHSHWIEHRTNSGNMHYKCSHCGKEVAYPYAKKRWKYCIECGAKMDEEKENTHD